MEKQKIGGGEGAWQRDDIDGKSGVSGVEGMEEMGGEKWMSEGKEDEWIKGREERGEEEEERGAEAEAKAVKEKPEKTMKRKKRSPIGVKHNHGRRRQNKRLICETGGAITFLSILLSLLFSIF